MIPAVSLRAVVESPARETSHRSTRRDETTREPLPVLLVGNFLSRHGLSRGVCEELAVRLRTDLGWPVWTTSDKLNRTARLLETIGTIWRHRHEYAAAQVDVYSGWGFYLCEAACLALRAAGRPYALTLHGGNLPSFAHRWPARVRRFLTSAAVVTTPSDFLFRQMSPFCPHLRLLPNALSLNQYRFRVRSPARPRLVWLRAFNEIYNPTLAPRVVSLLKPDFPDIQLVMVGADKRDGSFQATRQLAQQLDVAEHLSFPGVVPKSEVPTWLDRGDVFLNTTNVDNTPVSVLEAMASGLSVVSTNVGGLPYLLEHERDSLLVPPEDAPAMATAIRRLILHPDLARSLSAAGRHKAERFDWSVVLPQWRQVFLECVPTRQG